MPFSATKIPVSPPGSFAHYLQEQDLNSDIYHPSARFSSIRPFRCSYHMLKPDFDLNPHADLPQTLQPKSVTDPLQVEQVPREARNRQATFYDKNMRVLTAAQC